MNAPATIVPVEELQAMNDLASRFARRELAAHVLAHEYPATQDPAVAVRKGFDAGLFGITLPLEWGGSGMDTTALAGVLRQVAAVDAGFAGLLFTHAAALALVDAATRGNDAHADDIHARLTATEGALLACACSAAPAETVPLAVSGDDDTPRISGHLPFLVGGGLARFAVVPGAAPGSASHAHYLVDLAQPGVQRSAPVTTLGLQACRTVDVDFRDVPATRIGSAGDGVRQWHAMQGALSVALAGLLTGIMEGAFETALQYAGQRTQGGRRLVDWSGLRMKLADMAIRIDIARTALDGLLATPAAPGNARAAIATALHVGDLACQVASEGIQLLGGNGYMKDYGQEKRLRDARQARALLGTEGFRKIQFIDSLIAEQQP